MNVVRLDAGRGLLGSILLAVVLVGTVSYATSVTTLGPAKTCKDYGQICSPGTWDPVDCNQGGWFQNRCYADAACARGCKRLCPQGCTGPEP